MGHFGALLPIGLQQLGTNQVYLSRGGKVYVVGKAKVCCTQLMKAYEAAVSSNQAIIDSTLYSIRINSPLS